MIRYIYILFTVLLASFTGNVKAQFNVTTYQLSETLPQSNLLNPAIMPDNKVVVGLPGISSFYAKAETTLSISDLFIAGENDSLVLNTDNLTNNIYKNYRVNALADLQLFLLGIRTDIGYINFNVRARTDSRLLFPGEIFRWALYGPGDDRASNTIDFEDFKFRSLTYLETSAGYSHRISSFLNVGARIKLLSGVAALQGSQSGGLTMSPQVIDFQLQDFRYESAGIPIDTTGNSFNANFDNYDISKAFFGGNTGFGLDLGATFIPLRDLEVSASLIDIGFINWKQSVNAIVIDDMDYQFTGVDAKRFILGENNFEDQEDEFDSLVNRLEPRLVQSESFNTALAAKLILAGRYMVGERNYVGATLYSDFFQGTIDPTLAFNYHAKFGRILSVVTGIALQNRSINNLMLGFVFKPGPFQFYLVSDRLNTVIFPARADEFNFRLGMNLVFGRPSILE